MSFKHPFGGQKCIVLLSGGLDSTVNLYEAHGQMDVLLALNINYGQRAFTQESKAAKASCKALGIPFKTIDLGWFADFTKTSLVCRDHDVPSGHEVQMDDQQTSLNTADRVWVPNRNGIFLNIAAGFAEGLGAQYVIPGFNLEEASTFPDNSTDFMRALDTSFEFSTQNKVKVHCFTDEWDKTQIVKRGHELNVNFDNVWSCYFAGEERCGQCESCQRLNRALKANGI